MKSSEYAKDGLTYTHGATDRGKIMHLGGRGGRQEVSPAWYVELGTGSYISRKKP